MRRKPNDTHPISGRAIKQWIVQVPEYLAVSFDILCADMQRSRADVIRELIADYVVASELDEDT
jgi:metal-responsive CopG/Arc/MetJ family transcriptional regulator|tara:strand:- start:125 stop:316 length:192 start_codon:yes stop_codon:yes gene_type:complete